jgi:hypothetical protein
MLDSVHRGLVAKLTWPQFLDLLERLGMDAAQFVQTDRPAQRAWDFSNQLPIFGLSVAQFKEALDAILGISGHTAAVKDGSLFVLAGLGEILTLLGDPASKAGIISALAPAKASLEGLDEGLMTMSRCKEAHAALHDLSFKLPLLQKAARDWKAQDPASPERGRLTFELRRVSGGCLDDILRFTRSVAHLPPPSDVIFGNVAGLLSFAIHEIRDSMSNPAYDPEAPIASVLQPNVRQEPSKLQNLIALHARNLPINPVITAVTACNFPARSETLAALTILRDSTFRIEGEHHSWQFIDNQIRGMESPLENIAANPFNRRVASALLRPLSGKLKILCPPDGNDPSANEILRLAASVSAQLDSEASDIWALRIDFEDLLRLISSRFYGVDESLLDACQDMEPLCAPLRQIANLI